jgi:hypothetical protein
LVRVLIQERKDYLRVVERKREERMARIEGQDPNDEEIDIPLIHSTFPRLAYVILPSDEVKNMNMVFVEGHVNLKQERD